MKEMKFVIDTKEFFKRYPFQRLKKHQKMEDFNVILTIKGEDNSIYGKEYSIVEADGSLVYETLLSELENEIITECFDFYKNYHLPCDIKFPTGAIEIYENGKLIFSCN